MSLTRWELQVTSRTHGWCVGARAGAGPVNTYAPNPARDGALRLAAGWSLSYGWPEDGYPCQLDPATVSLTIRVPTAATLPEVDQGDDVEVWLFATDDDPTFGYTTTIYQDVLTVDDVQLGSYSGGLLLQLVLVDKLAALAELNIGATPFPAGQLPSARLVAIAEAAGINLCFGDEYLTDWVRLAGVDVDNQPTGPLLANTLAGVLYEDTDPLVLRARPLAPQYVDPGLTNGAYPRPEKPLTYVLQRVRSRATDAQLPYRWTSPAPVPGTSQRLGAEPVPGAGDLTGRLVVPARAVDVNATSWRKSREDSTNQVKLTGLNAAGDEATGVAAHTDLVDRFGANERIVESHTQSDYAGIPNLLDDYAAKLLPEYDAALPQWSLPEFPVLTDRLSDDEYMALVGQLWPASWATEPIEQPVSLLGIAAPWQLDGRADVHGVLIGATVAISDDVLQVTGRIKGHVLRPTETHPDAPTWDDLQTHPSTSGVSWDQLDPALTWRDLRLIGSET